MTPKVVYCEDRREDLREDAYKVVITVSVGMSLIGAFIACLSLPALYAYVQHMSEFSNVDLTFCDGTTLELSVEMDHTREYLVKYLRRTNYTRSKRTEPHQFGNPYAPPRAAILSTGFQDCPACCRPGVRGPPGFPGQPAMHGAPGPDGALGRPGQTPNASCLPERIFHPPPCLPCPQGHRGQPGHPGFPGEHGDVGIKGRPGLGGNTGPRGPNGLQGPPGDRGAPGESGDYGTTPEAHVIPGPPGDTGDPGPWGLPGHHGLTGGSGFPGQPGERGWPGSPGDPGLLGPAGQAGPRGETGPPGTPGTCVCQETEVVVEDQKALQHGNYGGNPGYGQAPRPTFNNAKLQNQQPSAQPQPQFQPQPQLQPQPQPQPGQGQPGDIPNYGGEDYASADYLPDDYDYDSVFRELNPQSINQPQQFGQPQQQFPQQFQQPFPQPFQGAQPPVNVAAPEFLGQQGLVRVPLAPTAPLQQAQAVGLGQQQLIGRGRLGFIRENPDRILENRADTGFGPHNWRQEPARVPLPIFGGKNSEHTKTQHESNNGVPNDVKILPATKVVRTNTEETQTWNIWNNGAFGRQN